MTKDFETAECRRKTCGRGFKLKREGQRYCSTRCRNNDAVSRHRKQQKTAKKSDYPGNGHQRPVGGYREAITTLEKTPTKSTASEAVNQGVYPPWDQFEGRLHLYLHDEAPSIGCGWRGLTVKVRGKRVRLLNHWTGDAKWITRETFERLAAHSLASGHLPTETPVTSRLLRIEHAPLKVVATTALWDGPPLRGDDYGLDYHEDGYPKLPACLRRRPPLRLVVSNAAPQVMTKTEEAAA